MSAQRASGCAGWHADAAVVQRRGSGRCRSNWPASPIGSARGVRQVTLRRLKWRPAPAPFAMMSRG